MGDDGLGGNMRRVSEEKIGGKEEGGKEEEGERKGGGGNRCGKERKTTL